MKRYTFTLLLMMVFPLFSIGQTFTITASDSHHVSLHFDLGEFSIDTVTHEGEVLHTITTSGITAPLDYGMPALPTFNRFIALPQGAKAIVEVQSDRSELLTGINIMPSEGSQAENDPEPPFFRDPKVYGSNAFYPAENHIVAEPQSLRGVDAIHLGLSPFQYNPVTHELAVNRVMDIDICFQGGNEHFGDDRLRSRYWDPILRNSILNYDCLEPIDYDARMRQWAQTRPTGCEYLIITPDNDAYAAAAQELVDYRRRQGILAQTMRVTETGATNSIELRQWFQDIYANWDIPPVAVCLIGESGDNLQQYVPGYTTLHPKDNYITSDNPYADVNYDALPDMCFARILAQNESELPVLLGKLYEYEYTNVVEELYYYNHPLTAAAWQNTKWFQITIATISCYLQQHGKTPVRINEIYDGTLGENWSTAAGTTNVVNYFGPNGLGRIPASPHELGGWTGGNADQVIHAINNGVYLIQHRDHGWNTKWHQPEIHTSDFNAINNVDRLTFLISVNCRTGMYDNSSTSFIEALLRLTRDGHNVGIAGAVGPTGQTYSFANDIFLWGLWDMFDPEFLPDYGPYEPHSDMWMPAFASVAGKYFLNEHVFPSTDESMRTTTFNTFHNFTDPFIRLFTDIPQPILTTHDATITSYRPFHITAPEGSQIALTSYDGAQFKIMATATGTGSEQTIDLYDLIESQYIHLTITGPNLKRHEEDINVIPITGACVIIDSIAMNGEALDLHYAQPVSTDIVVTNIGRTASPDGTVNLTSNSEYVTITQGQASFTALQPRESRLLEDAVHFDLSDAIPDGTQVPITLTTDFGQEPTERTYLLNILSPDIEAQLMEINDAAGNHNGRLDPGEYATLRFSIVNTGHYSAQSPTVSLSNDQDYIRVITPPTTIDDLEIGQRTAVSFDIFVEYLAGETNNILVTLTTAINGLSIDHDFTIPIGLTYDGFEHGTIDPEYWTNDPRHPWQVINVDPYEGYYCVQSDTTITHNDSSYLKLYFESTDPGVITFYSKVWSENNYDFLVFFIDNEEKDRWCGNQQWEEHSYDVNPGRHEYTWLYYKDYSVSTGDDCAWLDYITFPPRLDAVSEQSDKSLEVHPNPTTGKVRIDVDTSSDFTIRVLDANGKPVMTECNKTELSLDQQPAGLYHIVVEQNGHSKSCRIVKM